MGRRRWGHGRRESRLQEALVERDAALAEAARKLSDEIDRRWEEFNRALDGEILDQGDSW